MELPCQLWSDCLAKLGILIGKDRSDGWQYALDRYRWFVSLWSESEGSALVELHELGWLTHLPEVRFTSDTSAMLGTPDRPSAGALSLLSGRLNISLGDGMGWFEGECRIREE